MERRMNQCLSNMNIKKAGQWGLIVNKTTRRSVVSDREQNQPTRRAQGRQTKEQSSKTKEQSSRTYLFSLPARAEDLGIWTLVQTK